MLVIQEPNYVVSSCIYILVSFYLNLDFFLMLDSVFSTFYLKVCHIFDWILCR